MGCGLKLVHQCFHGKVARGARNSVNGYFFEPKPLVMIPDRLDYSRSRFPTSFRQIGKITNFANFSHWLQRHPPKGARRKKIATEGLLCHQPCKIWAGLACCTQICNVRWMSRVWPVNSKFFLFCHQPCKIWAGEASCTQICNVRWMSRVWPVNSRSLLFCHQPCKIWAGEACCTQICNVRWMSRVWPVNSKFSLFCHQPCKIWAGKT